MKIIATMGPSSMKSQVLKQLITSGLESIRLNFSHFHDEEFDKIVAEVRNSNKKAEIIGDLQKEKNVKVQYENSNAPLDELKITSIKVNDYKCYSI